jgi:hypothetical protein
MSNLFTNPKLFAKKSLVRLKNELAISPLVDRTREVDFLRAKHGAVMPIKKPVRLEAKQGREIIIQNLEQTDENIVIDQEYHIAWAIEAYEKSLNEDAVMKDYIEPAMEALGDRIELSIAEKVEEANMFVGTPGTTPANYAALSAVDLRMTQNAIPLQRRRLVLDPKAHNIVSNAERTLNLPSRVESQLKSSMVNPVANFGVIAQSNHVKVHTAGGFDANYVTAAAGAEGASSIAIETGTGTILKGDVFTFAGTNAVNPATGENLGFVQEFVVTADFAGGSGTLNFFPALSTTLPYKTVSALPASGAALTIKATHTNNFGFQEDGISLVMIPETPSTEVKNAFNMNWKGLRFLVTYGHDMKFNKDICRIDALWGVYLDKRKVVRLFG